VPKPAIRSSKPLPPKPGTKIEPTSWITMAISKPTMPRPTAAPRAWPTLSLMRLPTTEAITKVMPVARAAVATEPMPAVPIAMATRPLKVKPVSRL